MLNTSSLASLQGYQCWSSCNATNVTLCTCLMKSRRFKLCQIVDSTCLCLLTTKISLSFHSKTILLQSFFVPHFQNGCSQTNYLLQTDQDAYSTQSLNYFPLLMSIIYCTEKGLKYP